MPVEIKPFNQQNINLDLSIPPDASVRLRPHAPNTIPTGYDANFRIDGVEYNGREYRERPCHTGGAVIEGDGVTLKLGPGDNTNVINKNIFRWVP